MKIIQGDITTLAVDAIVNAANQVMLGNAPKKLVSEGNFEQSENLSEAKALKRSRGGVDGAIHRAAAKIAVREVREFLSHAEARRGGEEEMEVVFCCFSERVKWIYEQVLEELK